MITCDGTNHPLVDIYRNRGGDYAPDHVVRWCPECGAVVVDAEMDGNLFPGKIVQMQHSVLAKRTKSRSR